MRRLVPFVAALVVGLGLLTWIASRIVEATAREWFQKDVTMRATLAVGGARRSLVARWDGPRAELRSVLSDITHDERIMAAAACTTDFRMLTRTADYPDRFPCESIGARMRPTGTEAEWHPWSTVESLPGGNVDVNAVPVEDGGKTLGFVVLVHDLSFVEHREAKTRQFIAIAFVVLAFAASAITLVAVRLSWRGWSDELRGLLQGGGRGRRRARFRPLLGDVRELVDRIVAERDMDREGGDWTPQRLAHTLNRYLQGEKVIILANREPYIHERLADGRVAVLHPARGLVTALEPVMRACSGTWIGHGSGSADVESADRAGRIRVPPGEESYTLRRVFLTREEEKGYYYGFSNEGLWPLCHVSHMR
ncbi:MAG TPA: trehalose-6-phosphate synthase, partial [Thermoanaerobaculia bacterium]|nr:trehalose-6-phosphate synthase [Thermoanaerobaculia bacterium]